MYFFINCYQFVYSVLLDTFFGALYDMGIKRCIVRRQSSNKKERS